MHVIHTPPLNISVARGGKQRHDTLSGAELCAMDKTVTWSRSDGVNTRGVWKLSKKRKRERSGKLKMQDLRELEGAAKAPEREAKLEKKRFGKRKKASELERLKGLVLVKKYKALKGLDNEDLADQLKYFKLVEKKSGFKTTGTGPAMRLQLQSLIFEKFGAGVNDLEDGDSGVDKDGSATTRKVRARKVQAEGGATASKGKGGGKKRKKANIVSLHGWEWDADEEFTIECVIGKMVAEEGVEIPGRGLPGWGKGDIKPGELLYKVLWEGFPPELATWEEEEDVPCGEVDFVAEYEALLAEEEEAGQAAGADASDSDSDSDADE